MKITRSMIREILLEEIGRNYHTVNNDPHLWDSFQDYQIEYFPLENGQHMVDVSFKGEKLVPTARKNTEAECKHFARMVVDKHRITAMNDQL
jgi:hypothetical protein